MATTCLTLDHLPVETLTRIASFLPCESALRLMKVNRRMYTICNDELVFKAIIKNGNWKHYASEERDVTVSPWNLPTTLALNPNASAASVWSRFALADSRARDLLSNLGSTDGIATIRETAADLALWLPQIVAFLHPIVTEMSLPHLAVALNKRQPQLLENMLLFCVSTAILHQDALVDEIDPLYGGLTIHRLKQLDDRPIGPGKYHLVPIVFAWAIQKHCQTINHQSTIITPPSPERIPFSTLMDLPLPFTPIPSFEATFLPRMMSPRFLEDGEWVGYYSLSMDLDSGRDNVDPPMQGIRFSTTVADQDQIVLQSAGFDNVGPFVLNGTINTDGSARFQKTYAAGFCWEWKCWMTPVGLVGVWGTGADRMFGHVWLWKREWCGTSSPQV